MLGEGGINYIDVSLLASPVAEKDKLRWSFELTRLSVYEEN